jgi:hypothetical protein
LPLICVVVALQFVRHRRVEIIGVPAN